MVFFDFIMLGFCGVNEQAALTPENLLVFVLLGLGWDRHCLYHWGFASNLLAKNRKHEASAKFWQAIWYGLAFGIIILGFLPYLDFLVSIFQHPEEMRLLEVEYLSVILLSFAPTVFGFLLQMFFVGEKKPWVPLYSAIISNVVNILVSYILII